MAWVIVVLITSFLLGYFFYKWYHSRSEELFNQILKMLKKFPAQSYTLCYEEVMESYDGWICLKIPEAKIYFSPVSLTTWRQLLILLSGVVNLYFVVGDAPPREVEITKKEPA